MKRRKTVKKSPLPGLVGWLAGYVIGMDVHLKLQHAKATSDATHSPTKGDCLIGIYHCY